MGRTVPLHIKRKRKAIAAKIVQSSFQSYNTYVSGDELVHRIHPYLLRHVDYLVSIYPLSVAKMLLKLNTNKAKDKSVVLSFLKRLSIYHHHFIYKRRTTVINSNKKRISVFLYKLIKID